MPILIFLLILCLLEGDGRKCRYPHGETEEPQITWDEFCDQFDWRILAGIVVILSVIMGIWARSWQITLYMIGFPSVVFGLSYLWSECEIRKIDIDIKEIENEFEKAEEKLKEISKQLKEVTHDTI